MVPAFNVRARPGRASRAAIMPSKAMSLATAKASKAQKAEKKVVLPLKEVDTASASKAKKAMPAGKVTRTKVAEKNVAEVAQKKMAQKKVALKKTAQKKVALQKKAQEKAENRQVGRTRVPRKKVPQQVAQKKVARKTTKVALYARTSSAANAAGHSTTRQMEAATSVLKRSGVPRSAELKVHKVSEVISGMLPLAERTKLQKLLSGEFDTVIVESQRALARGVHAAEEVYQTAKKNNVNILVNDMPTLYKLDATPAESFIRRVMAAVSEFERDTIVARLQAGLEAKRAITKRKTQTGEPKVQGRKALLESSGVLRSCPSARCQLRQLNKAVKQHENGKFGWRPLAEKVQQILELDKPPGVEVVRRMVHDLRES